MLLDSILIPVWISLKTAVVATVITFCLGVWAAWWMSEYRGRGKGLIEGIFTAPLVLPPTVLGFLLLLALGKNGLIGSLLNLVGVRVIFTWYATVIAATVVAFPLMYKTALAAFQQNNSNLRACARTLGASETTIFWRITLPLAKPGLIAGTLLAFARALGEFGATLMLAGSIPGKTQTIPIAIFFAAESGAMDRALWLTIILVGISLSVIIGVNHWEIKRNRGSKKNGISLLFNAKGYSRITPSEIEKTNTQLEVDIQKQLPEFLLDIAFKIDSQQTPLGILGASGAGKTTLLRCIAGLETPDRGRIVLNDKVLFDSAKRINLSPQERHVGLLFQNYALFPHLTAAENIAFGMPTKQSAVITKEKVSQELEQVNLSSLAHRYPRQLSGGEQQRVALARALTSNPAMTFLDEPFSALDTNLKAKLMELLHKRLANYPGLTLYISHNLTEAYQLSSQLLIIDRGRAIAFDQKQSIINHPPNLKTAQIIGWENFSQAQKNKPQTIQAIDWQCELKVEQPIPEHLNQIAIHAHAVTFTTEKGVNIFPVWLVKRNELPHTVILYLKLHSLPHNLDDYHLQTEVSCDRWQQLQQLNFPWYVYLPPSKIIMFDATASTKN